MCILDHGKSVFDQGLNLIGGALAARAQPLHSLTWFPVVLCIWELTLIVHPHGQIYLLVGTPF